MYRVLARLTDVEPISVYIDQRTSERGYKHVVISWKGGIYGNDLLGQRTREWNEEVHRQTVKMIKPLLPKVPLYNGASDKQATKS